MKRTIRAAATLVFLAACSDDPTAPPGSSFVRLHFETVAAPAAAPIGFGGSVNLGVIAGNNGELDLTGMQVVVSEFELESEDDSCELGDTATCSEFESGPFFLDLPLDGGSVSLPTETVPNGIYEELDFEVEDLEDDGEADDASAVVLLSDVRAVYADWPEGASMRAEGTFTPTGGSPVAFVTYFDAEIEVELEFATPLVLSDDRSDVDLTIRLDPNDWFTLGDGSVLDLSQYDWGTTSELLDFEVEVEDGFQEIEIEGN